MATRRRDLNSQRLSLNVGVPLSAASSPTCPSCNSSKVWKDGIRYKQNRETQRWLCRSCGYRFSEQNSTKPNNRSMSERLQRIHTNLLKSSPALPVNRQICAAQTKGAKNLAIVEPPIQGKAQGESTEAIQGKIIEFAWWMKKQGYAESTILSREKLLKILIKRGADLNDPESVKMVIAEQKWSPKRKVNAADTYSAFLRMMGKTWNPPRYLCPRKIPFIPTEEELDALIAGCGPKTATFLQLLKETGARAGEAHNLQWIDMDFEQGTVRVTPEKGSDPRIFKLSPKLLNMLRNLQSKAKASKVFSKHLRTQRRLFQKQRSTLARKLQNPRLLQIHFHTFRHWKATMEYQKTKDILHVMKILGHKSIQNTLIYTQLIAFKDDEFISKIAANANEASQLVEAGFDYVCTTPENLMLFRKRK